MLIRHFHLFKSIPVHPRLIHSILLILFFCSGVSALIYQLMWQRLLFTVIGVDLQSVTIIVSVFMFGLGLGGLVGGWVADLYARKLLIVYAVIECCIAWFGLISVHLIQWIGTSIMMSNVFIIAAASFIVLVIPTLLMGATFPILVTHVNRSIHHVGSVVGGLYFANTIGGALGAYYAGFILLYSLNVHEAIQCAAGLNLAVGAIALLVFRGEK